MTPQEIDDATRSWVTAMGQRRRYGVEKRFGRPPWEEFGYFDTPIATSVPLGGGGPAVQLVATNPERVCVIMSAFAGGPIYISTDPTIGNQTGINISTGNVPFVLYQNDYGVLAQTAWYGNALAASSMYVIEVFLRRWPDK